MDYINKLKNKPEETRKQVVFIALVVCMSIVVMIWFASLGPKKVKVESSQQSEAEAEKNSPFKLLSSAISKTVLDIKDSVGEINISGLKENLSEAVKEENTTSLENENLVSEEQTNINESNININEQ